MPSGLQGKMLRCREQEEDNSFDGYYRYRRGAIRVEMTVAVTKSENFWERKERHFG